MGHQELIIYLKDNKKINFSYIFRVVDGVELILYKQLIKVVTIGVVLVWEAP